MRLGSEMPTRNESTREDLAAQVLSELATHISDFFWVRDAKTGTILYVNDVWERMTGQNVEVGEHFSEFFKSTHPSDIEMAKDAGRQSESHGGYDEIVRAIDTEGATRWMRVRTFPVRDANGETYRVVGIAEDVTELQRAEEALRNSAQRFQIADRALLRSDPPARRGRSLHLPEPVVRGHAGFPGAGLDQPIRARPRLAGRPRDGARAARPRRADTGHSDAVATASATRGRHVPVAGGHERQSPRRSGHRRGRRQLP